MSERYRSEGERFIARINAMPERYRPSNGTEGERFMARWCEKCVKDTPSKPCRIIALTMSLGIDHKDYPPEWVEDDDGPRCTAFADHAKPSSNIIRDKRQIRMPF